jgi:hypothetical protein
MRDPGVGRAADCGETCLWLGVVRGRLRERWAEILHFVQDDLC